MGLETSYISIGFDKNGEAEFGVTATIMDLSLEQMRALRPMIPLAIYVAEDMWQREQERKNSACQAAKC